MFRRRWLSGLCLSAALLSGIAAAQSEGGAPASAVHTPAGASLGVGAPQTPSRPALRAEMSPAELLAAYDSLRDQLRATQSALLSQRTESDERFRTHAQAMEDRLEALRVSLAAVDRRQAVDASRVEYELFRQQDAALRSTQVALWIAAAAGVSLLLGTLLTANSQRRAINRIADAVSGHPHQLAQAQAGWLPLEAGVRSDSTVDLSTQRLASTLDRIEERIRDLEHTTHVVTAGPSRRPLAPEPDPRRV
jgi:hypothetical protein